MKISLSDTELNDAHHNNKNEMLSTNETQLNDTFHNK